MLHAVHCKLNTVVSSRDTDVLLILVSDFPLAQCENLWLMCGTSKKRRCIPFEAVFSSLPKDSAPELMHWLGVIQPTTLQITPKSQPGKSSKTTITSWRTWAFANSQMRPLNLQKHSSAANVHNADSARHILFCKTGRQEARRQQVSLRFHLMRVHRFTGLQPILMSLSQIHESCLQMNSCACWKQML